MATTDGSSHRLMFADHRFERWPEVVDGIDYWARHGWVFRGQERADWGLRTSLEREFRPSAPDVEREILWRFVRLAPRFLPTHLIPHDNDAAAWLGLIQHYGGPTRLLDVTRSPYVALFFAFEASGSQEREIWAIDPGWCMSECARIMAETEGSPLDKMFGRTAGAQLQLVYSLVHGQPFRDPLFTGFLPFTGVFPLDPWKPDQRQSAQQALFLCLANARLPFIENLSVHRDEKARSPVARIVMPSALRREVLDRLSTMNVTAGTLFPDLSGLARSLRTLPIRRPPDRLTAPDTGNHHAEPGEDH